MQARFSVALITCLLAMFSMPAGAERVWVLGSYAQRANAESERSRLSTLLGVEVSIVHYETKDTWRVIAKRRDVAREVLDRAEVDGWLLDLDLVQRVTAKAPPARLPPSDPNESLWDYCERLDNAPAFCRDDALRELSRLRDRLRASTAQLSHDCERMTGRAHREICGQWQSGAIDP